MTHQKWPLRQDKQQLQVHRLQHNVAAMLLSQHDLHQHSSL
jgi:hypothetical protein